MDTGKKKKENYRKTEKHFNNQGFRFSKTRKLWSENSIYQLIPIKISIWLISNRVHNDTFYLKQFHLHH